MAMMKLTNTICEQCQHYARHTARKLSENDYFTVLDRTRSFNVSKKVRPKRVFPRQKAKKA